MKQPRNKSRSDIQQDIEKNCVEEVEKLLGISNLHNDRLLHFKSPYSHTVIKPDIYSEKDKIIGEVHVHIGNLKTAQVDKIASDVLKILSFEKNQGEQLRKIIVVCDEEEEQHLKGKAFIASAIDMYGIEIVRVQLDSVTKNDLKKAIKDQNFYHCSADPS